MKIFGCLLFVGFSIIGLLIKTWFFPIMGLLFGLLFIGLGYFLGNSLQKDNGYIIWGRILKIILPIVVLLNVLMAISKLAK